MTGAVVGIDAGGTKVAVRVEDTAGAVLRDVVLSADEWDAEPQVRGLALLDRVLASEVPAGLQVLALGIGAQGFDNEGIADGYSRIFAGRGIATVAVNDAALLVPAAGFDDGIGLIAGTGSIAVGRTAAGENLAAGGWGWVLGDEGGGAALVRDATRAALLRADDGDPDDGLLGALLEEFGVADAERLARAVNDEPTMGNWAPHAPAVFAAAEAGSATARSVLETAADRLANLVRQLVERGAVGSAVVGAGGVLVHQPLLARLLAERLAQQAPGLDFSLLTDPPVVGAVRLARGLLPA